MISVCCHLLFYIIAHQFICRKCSDIVLSAILLLGLFTTMVRSTCMDCGLFLYLKRTSRTELNYNDCVLIVIGRLISEKRIFVADMYSTNFNVTRREAQMMHAGHLLNIFLFFFLLLHFIHRIQSQWKLMVRTIKTCVHYTVSVHLFCNMPWKRWKMHYFIIVWWILSPSILICACAVQCTLYSIGYAAHEWHTIQLHRMHTFRFIFSSSISVNQANDRK